MSFLKRLLSVGGKKRRRNRQEGTLMKNTSGFSSSTPPIPQEPEPVDEDILYNRLLRSSSTHFSVISEGSEYRSMPPIPHPINNVLRAPSIISTATQADSYTVKVHRRMLHSCTEFPNANRSGDSTPSPPSASSRRHSLPPLTPGDKSRLARLRQDASVLSLLDIYDDKGNPDSGAFSNTPAKSEIYDPSLRALMGRANQANLDGSFEESDISWADRHIRAARRDSASSASSLGIPPNLFHASFSAECLQLQGRDSETTVASCEIDANIDSLVVERGTVEDTSMILQTLAAPLTSPTRRASQFFNFLQDGQKSDKLPLPDVPSVSAINSPGSDLPKPVVKPLPPTPRGLRPTKWQPSLSRSTVESAADQTHTTGGGTGTVIVRDGPKYNQVRVSPPPRKHSRVAPTPPARTRHQVQSTNPGEPKSITLGARTPFEDLCNADAHEPSVKSTPATGVASRSVSVASSVEPQIETQAPELGADPYTPVPQRRIAEGRRGYDFPGENIPPGAPARPVRGQSRSHTSKNGARPVRSKENSDPQHSLATKPMSKDTASNDHNTIQFSKESQLISVHSGTRTLPTTPARSLAHAHLHTPSRPSPASSSELSPQGRQIMASVRERARRASQNTRSWQPWAGKSDASPISSHAIETMDSLVF